MAKGKFKWVVEFEVDQVWVADGFNLNDDSAFEMLNERLGYAYEHELSARVIKAPDSKRIKAARGAVELV